jgi:hypothetical protein
MAGFETPALLTTMWIEPKFCTQASTSFWASSGYIALHRDCLSAHTSMMPTTLAALSLDA